jgi:hypothetical protein
MRFFLTRYLAAILILLVLAGSFGTAYADTPLPEPVRVVLPTPVAAVGSGTYRKFGFSVYTATLWAPGGTWDAHKPYALALRYNRDVSKDTLVDTVMDDITDQNVADTNTLAEWRKILTAALPDVSDGDIIIGTAVPGKKSQLFYNGKQVAAIENETLSKAFFNVWLGDQADPTLRAKLLGQNP